MRSNPSCELLNKRLQLYYTTNKAWRYVFTTRLPLKLGSGNGDSWSSIPAPLSRKSRIPNFCHRYPEHHFLSQSTSVPFGKFRFPASSQIPHPSTFSRIPHCLLVKSRIASTFSRNPALPFGQIPHPVNVFPNPALYFGQVPHPEIPFQTRKSVMISLLTGACSLKIKGILDVKRNFPSPESKSSSTIFSRAFVMDSSSPETHHPLGNQSYLISLLPLFQIINTYGNTKSSISHG